MRDLTSREKRLLLMFADALAVLGCYLLAFYLKFEFPLPESRAQLFRETILIVLAIKMLSYYLSGCYKGIWRYASMVDLLIVIRATCMATVLSIVAVVLIYDLETCPVPVYIIDWLLTIFAVGAVRFLARGYRLIVLQQPKSMRKVLIVGDGDPAEMLTREIFNSPSVGLEPVGLITEDPDLVGTRIHGVPVLGTIGEIGEVSADSGVEEVIIAMPKASGAQVRRIIDVCKEENVKFRTLPPLGDIIKGMVSVNQIRDVQVEDLLRRPPIQLSTERILSSIGNKRIIVTGAGGSIGSELCRQVAKYDPEVLILLEQAENCLYAIDYELEREMVPTVKHATMVADICDRKRVRKVFEAARPHVIFHAAAHKHVPLMESNPMEAFKNNVLGTSILAEAAIEFGADSFVLISTDKAVNPTSIMGASKRMAELFVQDCVNSASTAFMTVRFGNVLGSTGSVVPLFMRQIRQGGPVTVTHPDVTRYFMTIPEAVQLVLEAATMGHGGEVFVLKMGEQIRIIDLARDLIRLSGLTPGEDIEIVYTGLRPGEKLYEELLLEGENLGTTEHEDILVAAREQRDTARTREQIDALINATKQGDLQETFKMMRRLIPEYVGEGPVDQIAKLKALSLKSMKPKVQTSDIQAGSGGSAGRAKKA
ncbi:MAG: polysaccharide biosynthesis protein [Candidatus Coatesbacteria bacterium]|nr:polysaccharide biosynthesis protein [Candidatus Coatesbacteria bacterium]